MAGAPRGQAGGGGLQVECGRLAGTQTLPKSPLFHRSWGSLGKSLCESEPQFPHPPNGHVATVLTVPAGEAAAERNEVVAKGDPGAATSLKWGQLEDQPNVIGPSHKVAESRRPKSSRELTESQTHNKDLGDNSGWLSYSEREHSAVLQ